MELQGRVRFPTGGICVMHFRRMSPRAEGQDLVRFQGRQYSLDERSGDGFVRSRYYDVPAAP